MEENESTPHELLIFDVCDTLFYSNTTFDFIKFFLEKKGNTTKLISLKLLTARFSPVFAALALWQKVFGTDPIKYSALQLLRGYSRSQLETAGVLFVNEFLNSRKIRQTHELLSNLQHDNTRVILISGSLEPIVAALATMLQVDYRCSMLKYNNRHIFTGYLSRDLSGKKEIEVKKIKSSQKYSLTVVTDNFSDWNLMQQADNRYAVVYNKKAEAYWLPLSPNFIKLQAN